MASLLAIDSMFLQQGKSSSQPPRTDLRGVECVSHVEHLVGEVQRAGLEHVVLGPCVASQACYRDYLCKEAAQQDIAYYLTAYPASFSSMATYDPHDMLASVRQIERAVRVYGFTAVYVDAGPNLTLLDRRAYPAYVKAAECDVPVVLRVVTRPGVSRVEQVAVLSADFPSLKIVISGGSWPSIQELGSILYRCANVYFILDSRVPSDQREEAVVFLNSDAGRERCLWGSRGEDWFSAIKAVGEWGLDDEARTKFLRENAIRVFSLDRRPGIRSGVDLENGERVLTAE